MAGTNESQNNEIFKHYDKARDEVTAYMTTNMTRHISVAAAEVIPLIKDNNLVAIEKKAREKRGATDTHGGKTFLILAAMYGNVATVKYLIEKGADVNAKDDSDATALMYAAWSYTIGNTANEIDRRQSIIAQELIKAKADVNAQDNKGKTALMFAAREGHTFIAQELINAKANINAQDKEGKTALYYAADKQHLKTTALLLVYGPSAAADAATAEILRTRFIPADLAAATTAALEAPAFKSYTMTRRGNVLRDYYKNRGGRRTSRRPTSRKRKATRSTRRTRSAKN